MMPHDEIASNPKIAPVLSGISRPRWSVMIPTYNCAKYLCETLHSVLRQDLGPENMQIEVIDDCSTKDDPAAVVAEIGCGRVQFHRQLSNVGSTRNFNTCVSRSIGHLVHILHGDDLVAPGFYAAIDALADRHAEAALFATRSSYIDESGRPFGSSPYMAEFAACMRDANPLYYQGNPLRTPAIVIRRGFYEQYGGFCENLVHVADWEMWARAAAKGGAVMSNAVLACYREFGGNETSRLRRTAENIRDILRLSSMFSRNDPRFDLARFYLWIRFTATEQLHRFHRLGDFKAVAANREICEDLGLVKLPYHWHLKEFVKATPMLRSAALRMKRLLYFARGLP
jgi:glycosyltransferase involved in cell wall biosynthesis